MLMCIYSGASYGFHITAKRVRSGAQSMARVDVEIDGLLHWQPSSRTGAT
jgi:hypothetical protein